MKIFSDLFKKIIMVTRKKPSAPSPAPAPAPAYAGYVVWQPGVRYTIPTIVLYSANSKFYNLKQVDSTGTSNGTDPTISTWYWEQVAQPAPTQSPAPSPAPSTSPLFEDNFSRLDTTKWTVSTWAAPGANSTHRGTFSASNVFIKDGVLGLRLTQTRNTNGTFSSVGGEIATKQSFGFGTYKMIVKASSTAASPDAVGNPVSGSITGCFNYGPNSVTEIDYEVEGNERHPFFLMTSWKYDNQPNEHTKVGPLNGELPHHRFFEIKFVWRPDSIAYYRDGLLVATHTKVVPQTACPFMFNHWGTNNVNWGGLATPGVERYMWVKYFSFTPL